jgi:hypothetical protein
VTVSKPDQPASFPLPDRGGAGSHELVTDSTDPADLRALLERARERLSFYEGFDRLIGENIRRSGELMLETLTLREQAASEAVAREQVAAGLDDVARRLGDVTAALQALSSQVHTLRASIADATPGSPEETARPLAPQPAVIPLPVDAAPGWDSPRDIDVIAHQVDRAATALALQQFLGGLEPVVGVEAREFAEGVLRLHVVATRPLAAPDLAGWSGAGRLQLLQAGPGTIELSLGA